MPQPRFPSGFLHIIANETAERFSYYGMRAILVIYMTQYLTGESGALDVMDEASARTWYHLFNSANYLFPLLGSLLADIVWGKYKTIIRLSLVYCLGHLLLATLDGRSGLLWGLTCIAIGSGGIKPCVAAHLGDQFTPETAPQLAPGYSYFYLAINMGAFISTLATPVLLNMLGPHVAFGLPGLLMLIATWIFWSGRTRYRALPPVSARVYIRTLLGAEGMATLRSLSFLYLFVAFFWALFDQTGSTWVLQAQKMDRIFSIRSWQFEILPSQLQALNPVLILLLVPLCTTCIYPLIQRKYSFRSIHKIITGILLSSCSFLVIAFVEYRLEAGATPGIIWHCLAYLILTLGEVFVSITALEFSYTQAPHALKSFFSSFYLLSVAAGNLLTAGLGMCTDALQLSGSEYFLFFAALPCTAAVILLKWSPSYSERLHLAEGDVDDPTLEESR